MVTVQFLRFITKKFLFIPLAVTLLTLAILTLPLKATHAASSPTIIDWWPTNNAAVTGTQPFKGVLTGYSVVDYSLWWSVDNGTPNLMNTNYADYPHKEASVDVSSWNWHTNGLYPITYVAKDTAGNELARTSFTIYIPSSVVNPPSTPPVGGTSPVVASSTSPALTKPFEGLPLYVDPSSNAAQQASQWRQSRPSDAAEMDKIASRAESQWFGGWNSNIQAAVSAYVTTAASQGAWPVLVAYNIPQRDCGSYSAGGSTTSSYLPWIKAMAAGIGSQRAVVIVEPDALAGMDCLSASDQATRLSLLSQAITLLKTGSSTYVYLDAGHPGWQTATVMAGRLQAAGLRQANGFSLNVSNFISTGDNTNYGQAISALVSNKHFVIDTSRNGNGPTSDNQWCNPLGRALGDQPSTKVANSLIDAYLWVKDPGESDGTCNGGPAAGSWWADYALGLAQRAAY